MIHRELSLSDVGSEQAFHERLIEVFEWPAQYGRNLDALWDCLSEISEPTSITVTGMGNLSDPIRRVVRRYFSVMCEYQAEHPDLLKLEIQ